MNFDLSEEQKLIIKTTKDFGAAKRKNNQQFAHALQPEKLTYIQIQWSQGPLITANHALPYI